MDAVGKLSSAEIESSPGRQKYADIFLQPRPQHEDDWFGIRHPKMERGRRAKLFSAFDALDGYSASIARESLLYVPRRTLSEDQTAWIEERLHMLKGKCPNRRQARIQNIWVRLEIFVPRPEDPERGQYQWLEGPLVCIDEVEECIWIGDVAVRFQDIASIEIGKEVKSPEESCCNGGGQCVPQDEREYTQ